MSGSWQNHGDVVLDPNRTIFKNVTGEETGAEMGAEAGGVCQETPAVMCRDTTERDGAIQYTRDYILFLS